MIYFKEIAENVFELDKTSLKLIFTPNNVIKRMNDSKETVYRSSENHKGVNCKFWIKSKDVPEGLLFKYSRYRTKDGEEQEPRATFFGELLVDMICFYNNIEHTGYYPCCFKMLNGEILKGSISTNYKQGKYNVEYSAENITTRYRQSQYDNNDGKIDHIECNTVYEYIKQIEYLYPHRLDDAKLREIKDYLLQMALLDFLTLQTDRHWGNFGFMANNVKGIKSLVPIPVFDNECCFCLDEPISKIEHYSKLINTIKNPEQKLIRPMAAGKDNTPLLGIKTSVVVNDKNNRLVHRKYKKGEEPSNYEIFTKELAEEIKNNKKLEKLYNKLKDFNLESNMVNVGYFPDYIVNLAPRLYKERIAMIEEALKKEQRSEEEYEN